MSRSPQPRSPGELKTILQNLAGLLVLGVLTSLWILIYTDFLPAFGGLLTLTGAFAWMAFLVQLLRPGRREEIQLAFERRVLLWRPLWKVILGYLVGLLLLTLLTGTVEVRSYGDDSQRSLRIFRAVAGRDSAPIRETTLPARSSRKSLFLGTGPLRIKLSGLPALETRAGTFWPRVLASPDDFLQSPALLVRPTPRLGRHAARLGTLELVIERGSEKLVDGLPFEGRAVWVGCDRDVTVPAAISRSWSSQEPVPWLPPVDVGRPVRLRVGEELNIYLRGPAGPFTDQIRHLVRPVEGHNFAQEVLLKEPG